MYACSGVNLGFCQSANVSEPQPHPSLFSSCVTTLGSQISHAVPSTSASLGDLAQANNLRSIFCPDLTDVTALILFLSCVRFPV